MEALDSQLPNPQTTAQFPDNCPITNNCSIPNNYPTSQQLPNFQTAECGIAALGGRPEQILNFHQPLL